MNELTPQTQRWTRRNTPIPPCVLARTDLPKLFSRLQQKVGESFELHLASLEIPSGMGAGEWTQLVAQARNAANLTAFVAGSAGEQVVTTEEEGLSDKHLPDRISEITFNSAMALKNAHNVDLNNRFILKLDFSEPPGFDDYEPTSKPTPNGSSLGVEGPDETWVSGVHEIISQFFRTRETSRRWVHSNWIFLAVHWLLVLPGSIWASYRIVGSLPQELRAAHPVFTAVLYLYSFYAAFVVFRLIKLLVRQAWPYIEIAGESETTGRIVLTSVALGVVGAFVYDLLTQLLF